MNRFAVWTAVQVKNEEHPRVGQAGTVYDTNPDTPDEVAVKFDADAIVVIVPCADLKAL